MSETREEPDFDPQLKAAMEEIRQVCERFDIAFTGMLVSPTHSEFRTQFPTWSVAQFEDDGVRVRSRRADYDDDDDQQFEAESTAHLIDQWRNWHLRQLEVMSALLLMMSEHWEITSSLDEQKPHGHDILGEWSAHDPASQPGSRAERRRRQRLLQKQMRQERLGQRPRSRSKAKPKTPIASIWEKWQQTILAPMNVQPGEAQYMETRRAFYGGGWLTFQSIVGITERFPEDEAMALMTEIEQEFKSFHSGTKHGEA